LGGNRDAPGVGGIDGDDFSLWIGEDSGPTAVAVAVEAAV